MQSLGSFPFLRPSHSIFLRTYRASSGVTKIFDRELKWAQKDHLAKLGSFSEYQYLHREVGSRLLDRLNDIKDAKFDKLVDLGSNFEEEHINTLLKFTDKKILQLSPNLEILKKLGVSDDKVQRIVADEEFIPLQHQIVDGIVSNLCMHWVNDLPGTFIQSFNALKPNGMFMVSMFGGNTLNELRDSFTVAEQEREAGISPHVSPFARVTDVGNLLSSAGFRLPTIDTENIVIRFPSAWMLMQELGMMGEGNAVLQRRGITPLDTLLAASSYYQQNYQLEDGTIPATFEIIYAIGWVPHESQQKSLRRGTAKHSLKDI